jgi:hypothetical protein
MKFSHTLETTASPEKIWSIWMDIDRWPEWDTELKLTQFEGKVMLGATGMLVPKTGPKAKFEIAQLSWGESYTFVTQLILCKLYVHRYLRVNDNKTIFTHEVSFEGLTAGLFSKLLGKQFKLVLPDVMQNLRAIAEG